MALVFHFLHQPCCLIADSPLPKLKFKATPDSLVDEGWKLLTICLNFSIFETLTVQIRIQTPYNLFLVLRADKILQLVGLAAGRAGFKFESKFKPLKVILQALPKALPQDNRRFRLQNQRQWPSSWGILHTLGWVRQGVSESAAVAAARDWLA